MQIFCCHPFPFTPVRRLFLRSLLMCRLQSLWFLIPPRQTTYLTSQINSPCWTIKKMFLSCLLHRTFAAWPPSQRPYHRTSPSGSRFRIPRGSLSIIFVTKIGSGIFASKMKSGLLWVFVPLLIAFPLT